MIYGELYPWQKEVVDKNLNKDSFGLFLDCGLGKTPLSLALAEQNDCYYVLVITLKGKADEPMSLKGSWRWWALNYMWAPPLMDTQKSLMKNGLEKPMAEHLLVTNYESLFERNKTARGVELKQFIKDFVDGCGKNRNFAIIVDESHRMKDLQSLQTKAIMKIKQLAQQKCKKVYTYLSTGTPFTTGYEDLYSQLKFMGCPMTKVEYVDRFCIKANKPGLLGWQQPIVGYKNLDELYALIHNYAVTVKSEDVVKMPDKVFNLHTEPQTELFTKFITDKANNPYYRNIDYPNMKWLADTSGNFWMRARQLSTGFQGNAEESKWFSMNRLNELRQFLLEHPDNYIIFYNYTPEFIELASICLELGYNVDTFTGEMKDTSNYERYSSLTPEEKLVDKKNVIIANFASGSTGMNWQEYSHCIIFSLPLYKDYEQGIKRIHRLGQKQTVIYDIFMQDNFLERGMWKAIKEKKQYNDQMFKEGVDSEQAN